MKSGENRQEIGDCIFTRGITCGAKCRPRYGVEISAEMCRIIKERRIHAAVEICQTPLQITTQGIIFYLPKL